MSVLAPARLTLPELAAMMRELIRNRSYQQETRLGAAVAEYLAWARLRLAPRSLVIYEGYLARLCILLSDRDPDVSEVTPEMLLEGFTEHDEASFRIVRTAYSNLFRWAKLFDRRPDNPVDKLPRLRERPAKVYEVFTVAEQARLLKATDRMRMPRVQRLRVLCFLDLGVRKEEARLLQPQLFDTVNKVVVVTGKGEKERVVPIGDELWRALIQYRNTPLPMVRMRDEHGEYKQERLPEDEDYLFFPYGATKTGLVTWTDPSRPLSERAMHYWWEKFVMPAAGVKYRSLHMNRHSVGTDLASAEADSFAIADWLGHASLDTTRIYVHNSRSRLAKSRTRLDDYRQGRG
jgi:site-specific recombinase XerD